MSAAQSPVGFIATMETRHFSFEAHGLTAEAATETLRRTLFVHAAQYGLPEGWSDVYETNVRAFLPSVGFRDGEAL